MQATPWILPLETVTVGVAAKALDKTESPRKKVSQCMLVPGAGRLAGGSSKGH